MDIVLSRKINFKSLFDQDKTKNIYVGRNYKDLSYPSSDT